MEYRKVKLKEIANINMGQSPKGSSYNNQKMGMPFLQGNRTFGRIYPNIDTWTTEPNKIGKKNSILMSVRAPVGDLNIANQNVCIGRGLCSIEMKNKNNKYLYYLLINSINVIKRKSTGTVFDSINRKELEEIEVLDFDETQQNKIVNILFSIDQKIELNNQINDNLYKIIKIIYKEWFENGETINNGILDKLGNYLEIERGLSYKGKFLAEEGTPMINLGNIMPNGVFRLEKNKFYTGDYKEKVTTNVGDIVIANTDMTQDRAVIGTPVIIPPIYDGQVIFSHHIYGLKNLKLPKMYIFYSLLSNRYNNIVAGSVTGTTVLALPKEIIQNYEILIPNKEKLNKFEEIAETMQKRREQIILENIQLEKLRDTLLPKLINGEINLENIEI